jgi:flagellar assembly protein FliH
MGKRFTTPRQVPPPNGDKAAQGTPYTRFIPKEELGEFANWTPGNFGETGGPAQAKAASAQAAPPPSQDMQGRLHAARQSGYQDGYRDGLVALEGFKQSFAAQMSQQLGTLLANFTSEIEGLEQQMAQALAQAATQLAKQVVRSEITLRPEAVVQVAQEAVNAVLMNARHITVHVHPEDYPIVFQGAADAVDARGARLMADPAIKRGGVLVESDVGVIDAGIEARWEQASTQLGGLNVHWKDDGNTK